MYRNTSQIDSEESDNDEDTSLTERGLLSQDSHSQNILPNTGSHPRTIREESVPIDIANLDLNMAGIQMTQDEWNSTVATITVGLSNQATIIQNQGAALDEMRKTNAEQAKFNETIIAHYAAKDSKVPSISKEQLPQLELQPDCMKTLKSRKETFLRVFFWEQQTRAYIQMIEKWSEVPRLTRLNKIVLSLNEVARSMLHRLNLTTIADENALFTKISKDITRTNSQTYANNLFNTFTLDKEDIDSGLNELILLYEIIHPDEATRYVQALTTKMIELVRNVSPIGRERMGDLKKAYKMEEYERLVANVDETKKAILYFYRDVHQDMDPRDFQQASRSATSGSTVVPMETDMVNYANRGNSRGRPPYRGNGYRYNNGPRRPYSSGYRGNSSNRNRGRAPYRGFTGRSRSSSSGRSRGRGSNYRGGSTSSGYNSGSGGSGGYSGNYSGGYNSGYGGNSGNNGYSRPNSSTPRNNGGQPRGQRRNNIQDKSCFRCGGPHLVKDCPHPYVSFAEEDQPYQEDTTTNAVEFDLENPNEDYENYDTFCGSIFDEALEEEDEVEATEETEEPNPFL